MGRELERWRSSAPLLNDVWGSDVDTTHQLWRRLPRTPWDRPWGLSVVTLTHRALVGLQAEIRRPMGPNEASGAIERFGGL